MGQYFSIQINNTPVLCPQYPSIIAKYHSIHRKLRNPQKLRAESSFCSCCCCSRMRMGMRVCEPQRMICGWSHSDQRSNAQILIIHDTVSTIVRAKTVLSHPIRFQASRRWDPAPPNVHAQTQGLLRSHSRASQASRLPRSL